MAETDAQLKALADKEAAYLRLVHPTPEDIPSCMTLLENFWQCHRIVNQFKSLYRYGQRVPCSSKMDDYKFCMSIKFMDPQEKYEAWIQRRALWWAKRRLGKSSEDVWSVREKLLKNYPPEDVDASQFRGTEMW